VQVLNDKQWGFAHRSVQTLHMIPIPERAAIARPASSATQAALSIPIG
jgi:hypothetical protein